MYKYVIYKGMSFYEGDETTFEPIIDKIVELEEKKQLLINRGDFAFAVQIEKQIDLHKKEYWQWMKDLR